jgi:hypothetical protein
MKINFELLKQIGFTIILIAVLTGVTILILSQLTPSNICYEWCNQHNGQFYIMSDCDGDVLPCSGWCETSNQTLYCKDILNNITTMES